MKEMRLEVGLDPPTEQKADDEKIDLILGFIKDKKVAYPAEICGFLDIPKDTVYRKLRFLEGQGKIERLSLEGKRFVPKWIEPRLPALWKRGLKGDAIRRISWYRVVSDDGKSKKDSAKSK